MTRKFWRNSFFRQAIRITLLSLALILILFPVDNAQGNQQGKDEPEIEEELMAQIRRDGSVGYLIYFGNNIDLSPAYSMEWEERGNFVYNALQEAAEESQKDVRAFLDEQGVSYQSFWIENVIIVEKSNFRLFNQLKTFPEIESLRARRIMTVIEPVKENDASSVLGIEENIAHVAAPDVWNMGYTGKGIIVANIDTGVRYTHQALRSQYRGNLGEGSFNHNYNWWDPYGSYNSPADDNGHGSHTMGIMVGDDGGSNQIGMAPDAEWIACRACAGTSCTDEALLECAQFIAAPWDLNKANPNPSKRPHIVNNSWGDCSTSYDDWYQDVVDAWHAAGIYPVFSNGNASNCYYSYPPGLNTVGNPARYGNVTGVGSSGKSNGLYASHSNWGPTDDADTVNPRGYPYLKPQVIAPGVFIRSSYATSDAAYANLTGTSMSAPHVSGLVALMWDAAPCLVGDYANSETIIEETANPVPYNSGGSPPPGPGNVPNYATGWGEIDALAAAQASIEFCGGNFLSGKVTSSFDAQPISEALVTASSTLTYTTHTDEEGDYSFLVYAGVYTVTASSYGYATKVITDVVVNGNTTLDISLDPLPNWLISGTVVDASAGWPVYAQITIDGYPGSPIWTDPISGWYSIMLAQGTDYVFKVEDFWSSYSTENVNTGILNNDLTLDISLNISDTVCTAPGYYKNTVFSENFDSGVLPTGWTIVDNASTGAVWTFDDAGGRSNLTGGTGLFAIADSDQAGRVNMDTELRTPQLDFTGYTSPKLEFKYDWRVYDEEEIADVDISTNGSAGPWTNIWRRQSSSDRGPKTAKIDLSAYSGQSNIMLRFHYFDAFFEWWWQVDDVLIYDTCAHLDGGLAAGHIFDKSTSQPINDAEISNDSINVAASLPTPADPNVDDGFYTIFSLADTHIFTATKPGYSNDIASINVISSSTVTYDFWLYPSPAANFSASPVHGSAPLTVQFTDISTGIITSWLWDFGDGGTSNLQNPSHEFASEGRYDISLTIGGPGGSDQEVKTGYIWVCYINYIPFLVRDN